MSSLLVYQISLDLCSFPVPRLHSVTATVHSAVKLAHESAVEDRILRLSHKNVLLIANSSAQIPRQCLQPMPVHHLHGMAPFKAHVTFTAMRGYFHMDTWCTRASLGKERTSLKRNDSGGAAATLTYLNCCDLKCQTTRESY